MTSRTYQLSWRPNPCNRLQPTNFSHALLRSRPAEVLSDAVARVTGVPDKFPRAPKGKGNLAIGQATPVGRHSLSRKGYVMRVFGRPQRMKTCDCERSNEPSMAQALYLMSDQEINEKLADRGCRTVELMRQHKDDRKIVEELYLCALSRFPTEDEVKVHIEHVAKAPSRRDGLQDVLWSLLNVREFLFLH